MSTCAVTEFNTGVEASSDSDDEDKLHIVEEDSLLETDAAKAEGTAAPQDSQDTANTTVLPINGCLKTVVKEECVSEEEEEVVKEMLQQGDTEVIYPEAPDDEQSPAETGGNDENGTPEALHTCPYCSRGYKRNASLKEHIKYRHETSEDNYSCSHCSYTFTYRSQLERHMSHHRGTRDQRHVTQTTGGSGGIVGTRKFKCTECSKAFKYKHHLKEHLRIHSGEKPYECSNCKKRFSHSGSYSSHISSKKCVSAAPPNGTLRIKTAPACTTQSAPIVIAPARVVLKEKTESKPLQEQLPVTQIKSEPVEYECKPVLSTTSTGTNGVVNGGTATVAPVTTQPQGVTMVVPTMGLMSPISINISDLQNVLKAAMDGNVLRQVLGNANGVVTQGKQGIVVQQGQQQIISLPAFVDHDGTTKIIINYSISPANATTTTTTQPISLVAKTSPLPLTTNNTTAAAPSPRKTDTSPTPEAADLSMVKTETIDSVPIMETEAVANTENKSVKSSFPMPRISSTVSTCLLCEDCPDNLEALHLLQHRKAANGEAVDSAALDPSFAALLSEAGVTLEEAPVDDLLTLLKNYFASNANPGEKELTKIAESVRIPVDVVGKWFAKMNSGKNANTADKTENSLSKQNGEAEEDGTKDKETSEYGSASPSNSLNNGDLVIVKQEPEDPEDTPVSSQAEPLDLSLPKIIAQALATSLAKPASKQQEHPLNLTVLRKEQYEGRTIYVTTSQSGRPINIVAAAGQLPTLLSIGGQPVCLSSINTTKQRTILIPQLTYTYATAAGNTTGAKTVVLNGHTEKRQESSTEAVATLEDLAPLVKKQRMENGVFPCDLCNKVFQKGSSLLRHKYEHTGKRPHECEVCKKAFKHKHHLIEHSRLHSGEKPYECDKCGKRFSHSGSYSQHMNHRYSYCKKEGAGGGEGGPNPGSREGSEPRQHAQSRGPMSGSRTPTPPSQLDSEESESEEEDDEDDEAMCMDDIRVVQVDDGTCEIFQGNFEVSEDEDVGEEGLDGENANEDIAEEVELGAEEEVERTKEEEKEDKTEATANDCEADTDKSSGMERKELSDEGGEVTEEVVANAE